MRLGPEPAWWSAYAVTLMLKVASPMAKRKPPQVTPHLSPGLASARAQEKSATLRRYYELGQRANATGPDGTPKQPEPLKDLAAEAGVQEDTIRKALKFATTYTAGDLEELLALRGADGEPMNWYRVRVLLQVKDKSLRSKLQREAVEKGWSRRDLWAAVQSRQGGKKSPGGRRFSVPDSPQQVLGRLTELSESWLRFYQDVGEEGGLAEKLRTAKRQGKRTAGLKHAVREAVDRLHALQEAASKLAIRLEEIEPEGKGEGRRSGRSTGTKSGADDA